jgi:4-methyl-5(b-hydroxyethyl)-thiazole monophosphate biosynthesis
MKKVLLLFCQGTEIMEAAAFYDVLGWSGSEGLEPVKVVTVGLRKEVTCTFGLKVVVDVLLPDVDPDDYVALAIPGGFEEFGFYQEAFSPEVQALISRFAELAKPISSICVGALPIARTGLLKGKPATVYHLGDGRRRKQLADFGASVVDEPVVRAGNITTSTSPATAAEVALDLLAQVTSAAGAARIRHLMGFAPVRK